MFSARHIIFLLCFLAFIAHAFFTVAVRSEKAQWLNTPPVPSIEGAALMTLGDKQMAYRMIGMMLQNLGNSGGKVTSLQDYNFERLGQWFVLEDHLDRQSEFIPYLAAYYFGGTQDASELGPVIDYLAMIGQRPYSTKWRWLAHAVYLARFRQQDMQKAAGLAEILAALWHPGMPGWVKQMPAFVALQMGDKQAAYQIMLSILKDEGRTMPPAEVNFMISYICERVLTPAEAITSPLCVAVQK